MASGSGWVHVARTESHAHYGYDERRGKAAMDEIGILPQFTGTLVRDGFPSYKWYERCQHTLCNVHLLRELVYIEEVDPEQKVWTEPLRDLLFTAKEAVSEAKTSGEDRIDAKKQNSLFRHYGKILKQADELNPQPPKRTRGPGPPVKKREAGPTPRSIINRLQKKRRDPAFRDRSHCTFRQQWFRAGSEDGEVGTEDQRLFPHC